MSAEELSRGEKAAVARAVHAGKEPHLKDPEHADAAEAYAEQVKKEGGHGQPASPKASHKPGELSSGEKAAVSRQVHAGKPVEDLPFVQGHPRKLERANEYAESMEK